MADDRHQKEYSQHMRSEDRSYRRPQSHYPHQPTENSNRSSEDRVTLPSMHDHRSGGYAHPPPAHQTQGYSSGTRYVSPNATNGYPPPPPPPPHSQAPNQPGNYLPPPQSQPDARSSSYRPHDPYAPARQGPQYQSEQYYPQHHTQGLPYPPGSHPYAPQGHPASGPYVADYASSQGPPMAQAAPRQRTSIACKYCRKRKIRCSGYQSAPGGKCQNCSRMNQECVFQPVSSSSSTAFIPVSAVPGGVPPGTVLYGAYGQPLPQSHPYPSGASQQQQPPPPPPGYYQQPPPQSHSQQPQQQQQPQQHQAPHHPSHGGHPSQRPANSQHQQQHGQRQPPSQPHHPQQGQPARSPAESAYSYEGSQSGRRRRRSSDDREEGPRLPPPRVGATEEEARRRSPAEHSATSSPGINGFPPYALQSPHNPALAQLSAGSHGTAASTHASAGKQGQQGYSGSPASPSPYGQLSGHGPTSQQPPSSTRSPLFAVQSTSPAAPHPSARGTPPTGQQGSSVMSLSNIVEQNSYDSYDRGMIDRLNRGK